VYGASLKNEMLMVDHGAEGVNPVAEATGPFLQEKQGPVAIGVRQKDVLSAVAAEDDVIKAAGKMEAGFACREKLISSRANLVNF
jgi:hypothetical protein